MNTVFVDSGGFFASMEADDAHHRHAKSVFVTARAQRWKLITTNAVVYETHALLTERRVRRIVVRPFDSWTPSARASAWFIALSLMTNVRPWRSCAATRTRTIRNCDALSFAVMERAGITQAIAFDRHFREYGRWTLL